MKTLIIVLLLSVSSMAKCLGTIDSEARTESLNILRLSVNPSLVRLGLISPLVIDSMYTNIHTSIFYAKTIK